MSKSLLSLKGNPVLYHLPSYPDSIKGLTAIVAGSNGISGANMIVKNFDTALERTEQNQPHMIPTAYLGQCARALDIYILALETPSPARTAQKCKAFASRLFALARGNR
jgi:hypothetical protein